MTFSGMFAIGLSGVNAYATSLETVSNNIANSQTTGFKRAQTDFSTLVSGEKPDGGIEAGGVKASARILASEQGAISRTNSSTDLAIAGDGFFVVSKDANTSAATSEMLFTRSGGFSLQANGDLMNEAGFLLRGASVGADGAAALGGIESLQTISIDPNQTLAAATENMILAGRLNQDAPIGASLTQQFSLFDANGVSRDLAVTFTKTGALTWAANAVFADTFGATAANGNVVFNSAGQFDAAASSFPSALTNGSQNVAINFSGLTQATGASTITNAQTDGAAPGELTGVEVSENGRVTALFSNGLRRDVFQVALANFINPEGLEDGPASTFLASPLAGNIQIDVPQTGRAGAIESSALEISTVDIGLEFTTLIETQRAYSANTRIIT
ncbi:MAG: flagellar hook-basal body complex protein, partial [Marinicaulis sp.]|nr:flagellar hook-basal body complex protein [Marinicaulis sp.]